MFKQIGVLDFIDEFRKMDRDNFSYDALKALYDYIEEVDQEYVLDVIALCCDFSEMTHEEAIRQYDLKSIDDLENDTTVVWKNDTHILFGEF